MKPVKSLFQFSTWLMRLTIAFFLFVAFWQNLKTLDFSSIQFYVALVFMVFGLMLLIGGFLKNPLLTVFSGLMLFFSSAFKIVLLFPEGISLELAIFFVVATTSLHFFTIGNKR